MTNRTETKPETMRTRAYFAVKHYGRLGSTWAEFYGRDVTVLLDKLEAVEAWRKEWRGSRADWDALKAILEGGER